MALRAELLDCDQMKLPLLVVSLILHMAVRSLWSEPLPEGKTSLSLEREDDFFRLKYKLEASASESRLAVIYKADAIHEPTGGWVPIWSALFSSASEGWIDLLIAPESRAAFYSLVAMPNPIRAEMIWIPEGSFEMGSPEWEEGRLMDEGPVRRVAIEQSFWLSKFEVTQGEFEAVMGHNPSFAEANPRLPVEGVSWVEAMSYCERLTERERAAGRLPPGFVYRLPTEAEWEYACRAGTTTAYSFGDDASELGDYAWYVENSEEKTQPVGKKKPNPWGLYDMHGNVMEWTLDGYSKDFYAESAKTSPAVEPFNMPTKLYPHAVRGGSWEDDADRCRSAARVGSDKDWKIQDPQIPKSRWYHTDALFLGFRVVRPLVEDAAETKVKFKGTGDEEEDR